MHLYNFEGVKIPFDSSWKSLAVSVSGGADSALLAFMLASLANNLSIEIHVISHIRMWKTKPWQEQDGLNVFNWLCNRFPNIQFVRHVNFIPPEMEWGDKGATMTDEYGRPVSGDNIEQRAFAEYTCFHNDIDAYFNAVTRNPKDVEFNGMPTRDIDPTADNQHLYMMKHMSKDVCHPFRFTEKSWVIKMYKQLGINGLLDITRSCEGTFQDITYETYTPGQFVPTCGECFWCKERDWAIHENK